MNQDDIWHAFLQYMSNIHCNKVANNGGFKAWVDTKKNEDLCTLLKQLALKITQNDTSQVNIMYLVEGLACMIVPIVLKLRDYEAQKQEVRDFITNLENRECIIHLLNSYLNSVYETPAEDKMAIQIKTIIYRLFAVSAVRAAGANSQ